MNVKVIASSAHTTAPKKRPPWILLGIIGILIIALAVALWPRSDDGPDTTGDGTPTASTEPDSKPDDGITVVGEVVPGLWRGTAVVNPGAANDEIHGVPVGWPQTVDGAVGAAANYLAFYGTATSMIDGKAQAVEQRIYTVDGLQISADTDEKRASAREYNQLDADGNVLTTAGGISDTEKYFGGGQPRYGAYKVEQIERDPSTQAPVAVTVTVMVPLWAGVATDSNLANVRVMFSSGTFVMRWMEVPNGPEDWRIADNPAGQVFDGDPPRQVNQGWQQLRAMLGPGWIVPADGTQDKLPGQVLAA